MRKFVFLLCMVIPLFLPFSASGGMKGDLLSSPFLGVSIEGIRLSENKLKGIQRETGFFINFINIFLQWTKDPSDAFFPLEALKEAWNYGAVSVITFEPMYIDSRGENRISFEDILVGKYDQYLAKIALKVKQFNKPVIFRFAHEMNLSSYHWGIDLQDYNATYPEIYKKTYRYLYSFFRQAGVGNVLWAFCPNCDSVPNEPWNKIENYFPGKEFVDILGIDGYNFGNNKIGDFKSSWRAFEDIFSSSLDLLKSLSQNKPIFIFETASVSEKSHSREKWIKQALEYAKESKLRALLWFNIDKEQDWKIKNKEKRIFQSYDIDDNSAKLWSWGLLNEKKRTFKQNR